MVGAPEVLPRRGSLSVQGVARSRGGVRVLQDAQLKVQPGEFVTLLGPSGCGKTTLLRLIAGLDPVDAGRIHVSGRDVTDQPAHERPVHTVFQSYALFPHLSVFENVAFGLRLRNAPEADIRRKVGEALALVRLEGLESRRPAELSGGQGQRVALARALVLEPDILLLDEPLAALDAQLRGAMRAELVQLQRALGTTFILVTHDLEEAIECSSRIAVMRTGRIEQIGEPRTIFERPVSLYVAKLVGMENLLAGTVLERTASALRVDLGFATIDAPRTEESASVAKGGSVRVGVHGEHVRLASSTAPGAPGLEGTVRDTRYLGETVRCVIALGDASLVAHTAPSEAPAAGDRVRVSIDPAAWCVLPA